MRFSRMPPIWANRELKFLANSKPSSVRLRGNLRFLPVPWRHLNALISPVQVDTHFGESRNRCQLAYYSTKRHAMRLANTKLRLHRGEIPSRLTAQPMRGLYESMRQTAFHRPSARRPKVQ